MGSILNWVMIIVLVVAFVFLITNSGKSKTKQSTKIQSNTKLAQRQLPIDILDRIKTTFIVKADYEEVLSMIKIVNEANLNVGNIQLIRSILIIADSDKNKIKSIINSNYNGDPRDVIMEAMRIPGNTNDHGKTSFKN